MTVPNNPEGPNLGRYGGWHRQTTAAGAIIAQIDPVAAGHLYKDSAGNLRLPPLRHLDDNVDLNANGQTNVLAE